MKKRDNENESTVRVIELDTDEARYKYTLYVSRSNKVASYRLPLYSMRIEMWTMDGAYTEARTGDIFADLGKAVVFFERMADNLVTPINLTYIIEDAIMS